MFVSRAHCAAAALGVALLWRPSAPTAQAQGPQTPTFRTSTTLVEVSAIVTRQGETVMDLTPSEVEVFDNGVLQPLVAFEFVNLEAATGSAQRRDFVMVLDDNQIEGRHTKAAVDLATSLVRALGQHDRLAIVNTSPFELVQQLSTDRKTSLSLVRRLRGLKGSATITFTQNQSSRILLNVISNVSRAFAGQGNTAERRTVMVVSEGGPLGPISPEERPPHDEHVLLEDYRRVMAEASIANVSIYCVDPRGLQAPMPQITGNTDAVVATAASFVGRTRGDATMVSRFGLLRQIADSTGGTLVDERNNLSAGIPGMIRDSRQYYRLAYALPAITEDAGNPRRIEVRVKRADTTVRHRRTYAPADR